jgi:hypothetical protein
MLTTLSAAAVLLGGAHLALGASMQGSQMQGSSANKSSVQSLAPQKSFGSRLAPQRTASVQHRRQAIAPAGTYARANPRELGEASMGLTAHERAHLRAMAREIPRLTNVGSTEMRIDGIVPRYVRQAAAPLPPEVRRMHPRFSRDRAFIYGDQVVILNPRTSRIVALIKTV